MKKGTGVGNKPVRDWPSRESRIVLSLPPYLRFPIALHKSLWKIAAFTLALSLSLSLSLSHTHTTPASLRMSSGYFSGGLTGRNPHPF